MVLSWKSEGSLVKCQKVVLNTEVKLTEKRQWYFEYIADEQLILPGDTPTDSSVNRGRDGDKALESLRKKFLGKL